MKYPWLKINNKSNVGEIFIYGEITEERWYEEDVTPSIIKDAVSKLKGKESINMYVNSPGGGVFAGMAIYNMLSRLSPHIIAYVDGLAASIASVITLVADKVIIPKTAMMMIHNPSGIAMGDADEMRQTADLLDKVKDMITGVYNDKTNIAVKKIKKMMNEETWLLGEEAVELGFADEIDDRETELSVTNNVVIFNGINVDITKFKSFPSSKLAICNRERENVKKLRDRFNALKQF